MGERWCAPLMSSWPSFSYERLGRSYHESVMRFSRAQIIGAILLLAVIWLVIVIRLIISRG